MNCYKCIHKRSVAGNAHICCKHPNITDEFEELYNILNKSTKNNTAYHKLGIKLNSCGVRNGWAIWPLNFDPIWIDACNGYESIKT